MHMYLTFDDTVIFRSGDVRAREGGREAGQDPAGGHPLPHPEGRQEVRQSQGEGGGGTVTGGYGN